MRIIPKKTALILSTLLLSRGYALSFRGNSEATTTSHLEEESCQNIGTSESCNAATDCTWCESAAVASSCYKTSDSARLPPAVFSCDTSSKVSFSFLNGVRHTISDAPVDPEFCDEKSKSFSGYMSVEGSRYDKDNADKNLFFWFFEKRQDENKSEDLSKIPLIVWLTGGPGCSSTLALLTENGPCSVNENGDGTLPNPNSWTESAHMLWLDQPAGVGYSYGAETDKNEKMVGEDAYYFLQSFFQAHPDYASNPLFIVGESYGGHYAPAIAHRVMKGNQRLKNGLIKLNLKGLAVGNGLTNPEVQYQYYAEMAYHNSHNIQVIKEKTYNRMTKKIPECVSLIKRCDEARVFVTGEFYCQEAMEVCNFSQTSPYMLTGLNPYDIRIPCGDNPLCYDFSNVEKFLNLESTRNALHVSDKASKNWNACNMNVHQKFTYDWMQDLSPEVADLLNNEIPVLIYAGDVDFICNYLGNKAWTLELKWKHSDKFVSASEKDWGNGAGLVRSTTDGLTFMQVYDAGHMVPSDQPENALKMISTFILGEEF